MTFRLETYTESGIRVYIRQFPGIPEAIKWARRVRSRLPATSRPFAKLRRTQ